MNELVKHLVETIISEETEKNYIVVYSGRFQPFHKGHYATYLNLTKKFGKDKVYIATSNVTDNKKSPFNFAEKKVIMTRMFDIPSDKIVQIRNPYAPTEILNKYDPEKTGVIFVVGEKDTARLGGKYFTPYKGTVDAGYKDKGYVYASPAQPNAISGTDVRNWLGNGTDEEKRANFLKAYPKFDEKIFKLITLKLKKLGESIREEIKINVNVGDTVLMGKFKNHPVKVKSIGKDEHGMPTINGKKAATFRIGNHINIFDTAVNEDGAGAGGAAGFGGQGGGAGVGLSLPGGYINGAPNPKDVKKTRKKLKQKDDDIYTPVNEASLAGYYADSGEPNPNYVADGQERILDKGKPEPWFTQGGYTQLHIPKGDWMRGKALKDREDDMQLRKVYYKVQNIKQSALNPADDPHTTEDWQVVNRDTPLEKPKRFWELPKNQKPEIIDDKEITEIFNQTLKELGLLEFSGGHSFPHDGNATTGRQWNKSWEEYDNPDAYIKHLMGWSTKDAIPSDRFKDIKHQEIPLNQSGQETGIYDHTLDYNILAPNEFLEKSEIQKGVVNDASDEMHRPLHNGMEWPSMDDIKAKRKKIKSKLRSPKNSYLSVDAPIVGETDSEALDEMAMPDMKSVEKYADQQLSPEDVELGKQTDHFFQRLNDPRNGKPISTAEMIGFFKRLGNNKEKFLDFVKKYSEFVVKDNRTNINIAFMKQANKLIAKTVMRKPDFKTSNPIFVDEAEQLDELAWSTSAFNFVQDVDVPFTPKVAKALYGDMIVTTFHVSDSDNIDNIKKLIGKKKSVSTFTYMARTALQNMDGIQTDGGIIYQLVGKVLIDSANDIMSRPDEQGRRWVMGRDLNPVTYKLYQKFYKYMGSKKELQKYDEKYESTYDADTDSSSLTNKEKSEWIAAYIRLAEEWIIQHADEFRDTMRKMPMDEYWNEVVVYDIHIKDVLWTNSGQFGTADEDELNEISHKLNTIANGTVYYTDEPSDALKFVKSRGGQYAKANIGLPYKGVPVGSTNINSILSADAFNMKESVQPISINEATEALKMHIPSDIEQIYKMFQKNGKKLYIVGGAVRDAILGKTPKDFDLATDATPDEVLAMAKKEGMHSTEVGKAFGVVIVNGNEIATFRKDVKLKDNADDFIKYLQYINIPNTRISTFKKELN